MTGEKKNPLKGQVAIMFRLPADFRRDELEARFADLPDQVRGAIDWEIA